jgi:hypothetical protein
MERQQTYLHPGFARRRPRRRHQDTLRRDAPILGESRSSWKAGANSLPNGDVPVIHLGDPLARHVLAVELFSF